MVVVDLDDAEIKMDWETDEIDLPQNSDCSKLGDQNNKMNEEEERIEGDNEIIVSDQEEHHKS
ncbi:hypothetical protein PPACK8108_LOCUS5939 [Phakopsora pachyrhizi]|uniref:Uncharacterized protein n=1 Tax=Phakopsora pachyrhizi TaxID=170000 RepID=A0AAV0ATF1_PHAPC|nr:hypothetical protein PPACK8108_LOCUS5939 [Phakopsora pachyrhizi]